MKWFIVLAALVMCMFTACTKKTHINFSTPQSEVHATEFHYGEGAIGHVTLHIKNGEKFMSAELVNNADGDVKCTNLGLRTSGELRAIADAMDAYGRENRK